MIPTPDTELTRPWTEAFFGFRLDLQTQHRSEGTIRNRMCTSQIMARHAIAAGLDDPADVTYAWLAKYMSDQYQARKRGGPCSLYADLNCFWKWWSAEFRSDNPMTKIHRPREVLTDVPVLTGEQLDKLMDATAGTDDESVRDRAIVMTLLDSGLRRMEISRLDLGDVDLEDGTLRVRQGKGGKARTALIGTPTAQALWRYLRARADTGKDSALFLSAYGHRLTPSGIGQLIVRLGKKAGIDGLHAHQLRHTWCSMNLDDGIAEHSLAKLAGWSSTKQIARYGRALAEERALREGRAHLPVDQLGKRSRAS